MNNINPTLHKINTLKDEFKNLIFNTLDFCGDTYKASRDFISENDLWYVKNEVEKERIKLLEEYEKGVK